MTVAGEKGKKPYTKVTKGLKTSPKLENGSLYTLNTSHFPNKLTTHPSRNWTVGTPNHSRFGGCPSRKINMSPEKGAISKRKNI